MAWSAATNLYSAEANGRLALSSRVTVLAGFRWLQLNDNLLGTLTPVKIIPPFWNTNTENNLYGAQIGVDGKILELGRLSLSGLIKIGIFDDNAGQSTGVSLQKEVYPSNASTNHAAYAGEAGVHLKYQVSNGLALKAGYEALWLDGVALAPGQIQETICDGTSSASIDCACAWHQLRVRLTISRVHCWIRIFVLRVADGPLRRPSRRLPQRRG